MNELRAIYILLIILAALEFFFMIIYFSHNLKEKINFFTTLNENKKEEKIVTKVIDGDTIITEGGEIVRLIGIDCDERGEKCYSIAKKKMEELVLNRKVILERGIENKDKYGRKLRFIFIENKNINIKMIREGYCVARIEGNKYKEEIKKAEREAIENKIGCKWKTNSN